jgi:hypothetical protein
MIYKTAGMGPARVGGRCRLGVVKWPSGQSGGWRWGLFAGSHQRGMWVSAWEVGRAGVQGGATCHGLGGGALYMAWAATSRDVAGRGRLFCVGGSVVVGGLEPSG